MGYDPTAQVLEVEFQSGAIYRYFGVPKSEWKSFREASSKGKYLNERIKNRYRFVQTLKVK